MSSSSVTVTQRGDDIIIVQIGIVRMEPYPSDALAIAEAVTRILKPTPEIKILPEISEKDEVNRCGNCNGPPDDMPLDGPNCLGMKSDSPGCDWWNPRIDDEEKEPQDPPKEIAAPSDFWTGYKDERIASIYGELISDGRFVLRVYRAGMMDSRQDRAIWDRKYGKWRARGHGEVRAFFLGWAFATREMKTRAGMSP